MHQKSLASRLRPDLMRELTALPRPLAVFKGTGRDKRSKGKGKRHGRGTGEKERREGT